MKAGKENKQGEETELCGTVVHKQFGAGSKSEHPAVCLKTARALYKLRRSGGNPFFDPELEKLVGKKITATGVLLPGFFLVNKVRLQKQ